MKHTVEFLVGFVTFSLWVWSIIWAHNDAEKRGKPGLLIAALVFVFWPFALALWLAIRPKDNPHQPPDNT